VSINSKTTADGLCQNFKLETSNDDTKAFAVAEVSIIDEELTVDISVVVSLEHIPQLDDILVVVEFLQKHDFSVPR
jgi:hypothetical protein